MKIISISLKQITKGGATCTNPIIVWETPDCGDIRCVSNNGKDITLEVPDECAGECLYATISCDETCSTCEPKRVKVCPCTDNSDCADCESCIDGLCVSTCPNGVCVDGNCHSCDSTHPCKCNQICVNGDCQCPSDKPYKNSKDCCVDCRDSKDCPPCHICTENGCIPIDCVTGVCDPLTNNCVDCNTSGDCSGENECCVNHKCDCCPGFIRDPKTKKCVAAPDCTTDKQCPPCFICANGKCVPVICPEGYICVNGECVKECNCNLPDCPAGKTCLTDIGGKCYCSSCSGSCSTNGECAEGCYCFNGNCVANPCHNKTCNNGADCGEGCGCDNWKCVPCTSIACNDCDSVIGCECKGGKCGKVTSCDGTCADSSDCAPGCTCVNGNCVNCKDLTCDECNLHKGCKCVSGKCDKDADMPDCVDTFQLIKDDSNCDLTAELVKGEACACNNLTVGSHLVEVTKTLSEFQGVAGVVGDQYKFPMLFNVILRKGTAASANGILALSRLSDTSKGDIAENELPTGGVLELRSITYFKEFDATGRILGVTAGTPYIESAPYTSSDAHTFVVNVEKAGNKKAQYVVVDRVEVDITHKTKFTMPNGCEYKGTKIASYTFGVSTNFDGLANLTVSKDLYTKFVVLTSDKVRSPMFTWYRSADTSFTDNEIIRKLYIPLVAGKYTDTLRGMDKIDPKGKYPTVGYEGLLWSGYSYMVKTDCGCTKNASWNNLVFCNPTSFSYEVSECNKNIKIKSPFNPCDMNQDINIWKSATNPIPADAQAKYELYFDGVKKATFKHDKNNGMVKDGTTDSMFDTYVSATPVSKIELKHIHDKSGACTISYDLPTITTHDFDKTVNCDIQGSSYVMTINKSGTGYTIDGISGTGINVMTYPSYYAVTMPKGVNTELTFTLSNGCVEKKSYNEDCCESMVASIEITGGECNSPLNIYASVVGGQPPFVYEFTKPDGSKSIVGDTLSLPTWTGGSYSVKVTDANNCSSTATDSIAALNLPTLTFSGYSDICSDGSTNLIIHGSTVTIGETISYDNNGFTQTFVMPTTGYYTISGIDYNAVFDNFSVTIDSCTTTFDDSIEINVVDTPNAIMSGGGNYCLGDSSSLEIVGTPGATVVINNGVGAKIIPSCGDPACTLIVPVAPAFTKTYSITSVSLGNCTNGTYSGSAVVTPHEGSNLQKMHDECLSQTERKIWFNYEASVDKYALNGTFTTVTAAIDAPGGGGHDGEYFVVINPQTHNRIVASYDNGYCISVLDLPIVACPCSSISGSIRTGEDVGEALNGSTYCYNPQTLDVSFGTPINITGGTGPYTYMWSHNGATTAATTFHSGSPGNYSLNCLVTDSLGCAVAFSAAYTVLPIPVVTIMRKKDNGTPAYFAQSNSPDTAAFTYNCDEENTFTCLVTSPLGGTYTLNVLCDGMDETTTNAPLVIPANSFASGETGTIIYTYTTQDSCVVQKVIEFTTSC